MYALKIAGTAIHPRTVCASSQVAPLDLHRSFAFCTLVSSRCRPFVCRSHAPLYIRHPSITCVCFVLARPQFLSLPARSPSSDTSRPESCILYDSNLAERSLPYTAHYILDAYSQRSHTRSTLPHDTSDPPLPTVFHRIIPSDVMQKLACILLSNVVC